MKNIKLYLILLALMALTPMAWAQGLSGSGTSTDPYLISSSADWNTFAQSVTGGTTYAGQFVKLTADITASVMAGSHTSESTYHAFSGTFDGDGHTITLALSGSGEGTALFSDLEGATLKNLKAQGTVTTNKNRPATFAAFVFGNSTISNCWSTVAVSSTKTNSWVDGGGFVARVSSNDTLNMIDCAFHGSVTYDATSYSGGSMVGFTQAGATVYLTNCLYSPTALVLTLGAYNPHVFVSGDVRGTLTNCYYNAVAKASILVNEGTDASNMSNEALAAALGAGWHVYNNMVVPFTGTYYISSAAEWDAFATAVNNGKSYNGQLVALTTDIPTAEEIANNTIAVTTMAGTESHPFCGTFDGDGHTITLALSGSGEGIALFSDIEGATLKNLKAQGTVTTTDRRPATFAIFVEGNCTISNCWSTVAVSSTRASGWVDGGGFVGRVSSSATLNMTGCAFHGSVTFTNGATTGGGMVGYTQDSATVNLTNCLYSPTELALNVSQYSPRIFVSGNVAGNLTNCYYNAVAAASVLGKQGKLMHSITAGEYVTVAFSDQPTVTYSVSGFSAYSPGIVYDSTLYAGQGDTVSLNLGCTPPPGYTFIGYTATSGTLTGTANPYTLTMPNEAVTIQAVLGQPPVPYIDENGVEQQCTFYTVVTDTLDFYDLPAGWYVVNNDFTHNGPALIFGDAHLILCDGAMMNISYGGSGNALNTYGSLTLYGQSEGTGSLSATSNNGKGISVTNLMTINGSTVTASGGDSQGIYATNLTINGSTVTATGSSHGISSIDLTINGSTVTASANDDGGMGISANRVTINSGTVNATGNESGIYIGNEYGYVTINGGTVTVTGDYGIYSPTVTLGWSILTDSITVGNFDYFDSPTVSVKSGQAFYYEDGDDNVIVSGTLDEDQIYAIGGRTLHPVLPPVAYIDENGETQQCTNYTLLTGGETTLETGWYVADRDLTYNSTLTLNDDVTLILCNGKTMTVTAESGGGIVGDNTLTIYGQSLDSIAAGTLNVTNNDWQFAAIHPSNYIQHSGNVVASNSDGYALDASHITMNGGTLTANDSIMGIYVDEMTVNGGSIHANGGGCGKGSTFNFHACAQDASYTAEYLEENVTDRVLGAMDFFPPENAAISEYNLNNLEVTLQSNDEVLLFDPFEEYYLEGKIAQEAIAAGHDWWTTWSNAPGGSEDGVVANFDDTQCGYLTYGNDLVLLLGDEENGNYDLEFDILVPEGKNGYFNILHHFAGSNSTWAMQCYLHLINDGQNSTSAPGHGTVHAGSNGTADVPCVYDAWMHFRLNVDTDTDVATYYYTAPGEEEVLICTWQWSLDSFGNNVVGRTLAAMNFYPPENAATSEYYLDNFSFKKIGGESAPELSITPESIEEELGEDDMTMVEVTINNDGNSIGDWAGWLDFGQGGAGSQTADLYYHNGEVASGIGSSDAYTREMGIRLPATAYAGAAMGMRIVSAQYYIYDEYQSADHNYIFRIYGQGLHNQPGELLAEKTVNSTAAGTWITATFDEPIFMTGQAMWATVQLEQVAGEYPLSMDGGEYGEEQDGNWISTNGNSFSHCYSAGSFGGAWLITVNCQGELVPATWATIDKTEGAIMGGASETITLSLNSIGLDMGTSYNANLIINTNDEEMAHVEIPVLLAVTGGVEETGEVGIQAHNLTINGGSIHVSRNRYGIIADDMTINGGTVNSENSVDGIIGILIHGNLVINCGKVKASSISSDNNITLGWTNTDDYILSGNYSVEEGTVTVKTGQAFYYGNNVIVNGTLDEDQINAIGGKTLRPYIVPTTVTKDIAGYGTGDGGWQLIASPLQGTINPTTIDNLIADTTACYDLYRFNPSHEGNEWENYKAESTFKLEAGKGYLYANTNSVTLTFSGPASYGDNCEIALVYDPTDYQKCWNLVGNPFDCNATLDREYYVLSEGGLDINPEPIPATTPIPPCTAVFVKAVSDGDAAVFTKVTK